MPHNATPNNKKQNAGRHRLYTNEQRKDRNRQAQAAFRARQSLNSKTQKETITELQHMVDMLQETTLEANERASFAEKRCVLLENENQQLKTTMTCFLAQSSPPPPPPLQCASPLTSQSSILSPTPDYLPLTHQQPLSWSSSPSSSLEPTTLLLDECHQDHLESKLNSLYIDFLGEYSFILLHRGKRGVCAYVKRILSS
ncbi:unnamed protein product [Absidia cylindrospora]